MKWRLSLITWVVAIIGLPAGACAIYDYYTGLLMGDLNTTASLYLSMVSIMVTMFLTWYVYRIEQRRDAIEAKREEDDAKRMVATVLWTGLRQVVYHTGGYLKITNELLRETAPASRSLSIEQAQTLNEYMRTLQNIGDTELEDWGEANEKAWNFALRFLPEPAVLFHQRILEAENWEWLVRGEIRELLEVLGAPLSVEPELCRDREGRPVYQEYMPNRYQVWAADGRLLLDGVVQGEDVMDGYAELKEPFDRRRYCGYYQNGYQNGYGVEYFDHDETDAVSKEGLWKDGELYDGMIYQVMLDNSEDDEEDGEPYHRSPYDWILQFATPEIVRANVDCFPPFQMCNVRMIRGNVQVVEESIQTVEKFCKNWRPRTQPMSPSAFPSGADAF